jgi:primosomal protein N' (replication factor Y)
MLNYPPFCDIIQISFSGENLNEIKDVSEYVYKKIKSVNLENIMVYKPVPSPIDKIKNKYRWRIILKCKLTSKILDLLNFATNDENIKKCKNTRIIVDINPNTMN